MKLIITNVEEINENKIKVEYDIEGYKQNLVIELNKHNITREKIENEVIKNASLTTFMENIGQKDIEDFPFLKNLKIKEKGEKDYHNISGSDSVNLIIFKFIDGEISIYNEKESLNKFYNYIMSINDFNIKWRVSFK